MPDNVLIFPRTGRSSKQKGYIHGRYLLDICTEHVYSTVIDREVIERCPGTALLIHPFHEHGFIVDGEDSTHIIITFEASKHELLPENGVQYELRSEGADTINTC